MTEIIWHGRGGQGAFTAARLLGEAYSFNDGAYALAFPSFGPERRGAPIRAFTKLDTKPVGNRSEVKKADFSIFLDDTLYTDAALQELKEGGRILLNTRKRIDSPSVITVDADSIAEKYLGLPITNTILLGVLAAAGGVVSVEDICKAIELSMPERLSAKNTAAVRAAYEEVKA